MRLCAQCGRQVGQRARFCTSCGADLGEASAGAETIGDAPEAAADRTLVERVLGGDWRSAALVAGPTALVGYTLGLLTSLYLCWTGSGGDGDVGVGHSAAGVFHSAGAFLAMAVGSPVFIGSKGPDDSATFGVGMAPLTITLLILLTYALLLRSYLPDGPTSMRMAAVVRSTVLTAFVLAMVSFSAYATERLDQDTVHL